MKDSGVSPTDPEFIKVQQILRNAQQAHRIKQQYLQQQSQQQQQSQSTPNGLNGSQPARPHASAGQATPTQQMAGPGSGPGSTPSPSSAQSGASMTLFSQQQLTMLRQQISAFKL